MSRRNQKPTTETRGQGEKPKPEQPRVHADERGSQLSFLIREDLRKSAVNNCLSFSAYLRVSVVGFVQQNKKRGMLPRSLLATDCSLLLVVRNAAALDRIGRADRRRVRIDQVGMVGPEAQFDQRARVGNLLRLPAIVGLELLHGRLAARVPRAGGLAIEVVRLDQRRLDLTGPRWVDLLLPTRLPARFLRGF